MKGRTTLVFLYTNMDEDWNNELCDYSAQCLVLIETGSKHFYDMKLSFYSAASVKRLTNKSLFTVCLLQLKCTPAHICWGCA